MTSSKPKSSVLQTMSLAGQVALITGATGRLGCVMARTLAELGADLMLVARTPDKLEALKAEITVTQDCRVEVMACDAFDSTSLTNVFTHIDQVWGRLDVMVNNLSGGLSRPVADIDPLTFDTVMHQIVTTSFQAAQQAAERMKTQPGKGRIINVSSIYGVVAADQRIYGDAPFPSSAVYAAGKGALISLTRYLAAYWAQDGIRVNCLTPGGVEDEANNHAVFRQNYADRTPMGRMMQREEIAGPLAFLATEQSRYVTGQNLIVDGGFTIV